MGYFITKLGSRFLRFEGAKNYDEFAHAQNWAAKSLVSLIETFRGEFGLVYEIGCGSGLLTKVLLERLEIEHLSLNDLYESQIMNGFYSQIGDICEIEMPEGLDLVVSSSVFQWIDDLSALCAKIHFCLKDGGLCAFSMLCSGSLYELSSFTNQSLNYKSAGQIEQIFGRDFEILATRTSSYVCEFDTLRDLLMSLKETGVNNLEGDFVLNKSTLSAMNEHFGRDFKLTYNYIFIIAKNKKDNK